MTPPASDDAPSPVTVVLPNYNGCELLRRFLPSVLTAAAALGATGAPVAPARVMVVDDASSDESVELLRQRWPQVEVLVNQRNLGFGATANRGIEAAQSPLVFLLNTDAEPDPDVLPPLIERMTERPDAAAVVPKILQMGTGGTCESVVYGTFRRGLFRLQWHPELCETDRPLPVLYPCGAAVMLRRDEFLELGGFDTLFAPFYWEDVDLGYRIWRAGYEVLYEPRARVLHYHPGAIKATHSAERAHFMQDRNRFLFTWKNLDRGMLVRHFTWLPAHVVVSSLTGRGRFVTALWAALPALPASLLRRRTEHGHSCPCRRVLSTREILDRARPGGG